MSSAITTAITDKLVDHVEEYVKKELASHDASHDWWHVYRVAQNALHLGKLESLSQDSLCIVRLAALLHDVKDWKYGGTQQESESVITDLLRSQNVHQSVIDQVLAIIRTVGFKEELASGPRPELSIEAAVVQDADRLDAIGAVGIARCFTFGGHFKRVLHDPSVPPREGLTKEQYMQGADKATTINHFYEKLLKLKDMMKTASGRAVAQQRHEFMQGFLEQFMAEWQGHR